VELAKTTSFVLQQLTPLSDRADLDDKNAANGDDCRGAVTKTRWLSKMHFKASLSFAVWGELGELGVSCQRNAA